MAPESLDYRTLVQDALRSVVIRSLRVVRDQGLPGEHHFYITFATSDPEVGIAESLRERYPEEMTIVLQNDYRDLEVDDDGFAVTMRFGGVPQRLHIPLAAVLSFYDPSVEFLLQFRPNVGGESDDSAPNEAASEEAGAKKADETASKPAGKSLSFAEAVDRRSSAEESLQDEPAEEESAADEASENKASEDRSSNTSENNVVSIDAFRRK